MTGGRALPHLLVGGAAAILAVNLRITHAEPGDFGVGLRMAPALLLTAALALALHRRRLGLGSGLDRRFVLACCGVVLVLASIGPVRGSRDLWAYAMYGRIESIHHADAYIHPPKEYVNDPYLHLMSVHWRGTRSVYGPVFETYAATVTKLTPHSPDATRLAFKWTTGICVMAGLVLLDRRRVEPAAIAFAGLHPATVLYGVAGGHNDAMVGLALLIGVLLAVRRRPVWAAVALATACLIKVAVGLAIVAVAVWLWHRPDRDGKHDAVVLTRTSLGLVALGYLYAGGTTALRPLRQASGMISWTSFWRPVEQWLQPTPFGGLVSKIAIALVLVIATLLLVRHRHDDGPEVVVTAILLVYLAASAYALIWYLMWVLPIAALRWRTVTSWLVVAISTAYLLPTSVRVGLQGTAVLALILLVGASIHHRPRAVVAS